MASIKFLQDVLVDSDKIEIGAASNATLNMFFGFGTALENKFRIITGNNYAFFDLDPDQEVSNSYMRFRVDLDTKLELTSSSATIYDDLTIDSGNIILSGTGRIQGIDTVTAATDAASKAYVDTAVGGAGTVTSIGLSMPTAFSVAGSPITTSGTFTVTGAGTSSQYIDGTGALQTFPTIPTVPTNIVETLNTFTGDVSIVGGNNITVSNNANTITIQTGSFMSTWIVTADSGTAQAINNNDTLDIAGTSGRIATTVGTGPEVSIDLETTAVTAGSYTKADITVDDYGRITAAADGDETAESTHIPVKNTSGATITKGTPVYITGNVGSSDRLQIAEADASDAAKMPAVGLLETDLADNGEGFVVQGGYLRGLTTDVIDGTSTSSNDTVYVKAGGGLTMTKPTGSTNYIQNIAKVARVGSGSSGSLIVSSILRTNDIPNLPDGQIWVGTTTYPTTTTLPTGTVTSVGLSMSSAFTVTNSPITTSGTLTVTGAGTSSQYIDGTGSLQTFPSIPSGTVTSVGLSMPSAFTVTNSPVTSSGTLTVAGNGTSSQYIDGTGTLQTFPTTSTPTLQQVTDQGNSTDNVIEVTGTFGRIATYGSSSIDIGNGTASGDRFLNMVMDGGQEWKLGVDDSDNNKFAIAYNASSEPVLGTDDVLTIDVSGNVEVGNSLLVGSGEIFSNYPDNLNAIIDNSASGDEILFGDTGLDDSVTSMIFYTYGTNQIEIGDGETIFGSSITANAGIYVNTNQDLTLSTSSELILRDNTKIVYDTNITTNSQMNGTIIKSVSSSTVQGVLYALTANAPAWEAADADSSNATNLLAIATSTNASLGMLLNGVFRDSSHGFTVGSPLYVGTTSGTLTQTAPSGTGDYVRVVGYAIDANHIYFNPDNTWVQIS